MFKLAADRNEAHRPVAYVSAAKQGSELGLILDLYHEAAKVSPAVRARFMAGQLGRAFAGGVSF
jgi:hypothetical protein